MSSLYAISVDSVEGSTLRGRVHLVHPDAPYVPPETGFPVNLLSEAFRLLDSGFLRNHLRDGGELNPLSEEQGRAITAGMRLRSELLELEELVFGRKIRVVDGGFVYVDDRRSVLETRQSSAETFSRRAAAIVTSYAVGRCRNIPLLSEVAAAVGLPDVPEERDERDGPADL